MGNLSDPNMDANFLATLTNISISKKICEPSVIDIKDRYSRKYRGAMETLRQAPRLPTRSNLIKPPANLISGISTSTISAISTSTISEMPRHLNFDKNCYPGGAASDKH